MWTLWTGKEKRIIRSFILSEAEKKCELMIIGGGIAGMAASLFAANNGIKTFQTGNTSELSFVSGLIDLMGVFPVSEGEIYENPFEAIEAVSKTMPSHPLTKITTSDIHLALDGVLELLNTNDLSYVREREKNQLMITSMGTVKPSHCIPFSMMDGVKAYREKSPCLIVDIKRMKGFSARQIAETLKGEWPEISSATIPFPERKGEIFAEATAISLENYEILKQFAKNILPHIKDSKVVGLPAVLGMEKSRQVKETLEKLIGVPVFEIPMLPPSIPGIRIRNTFESALRKKGVTLFSQKKILSAERTDSGSHIFTIGEDSQSESFKVEAKAVILASGRFLGNGLKADYFKIRETIFDIPVSQPENRQKWHSRDFFDKEGHPINIAGIEIDEFFRPLASNGKPFLDNVFAAGSILAHNDWTRMKSGAGSAIATAYAAVNSYLKLKK